MLTTDSESTLTEVPTRQAICKVLFVDESHAVRQSAKACLDSAGCSVELAADGYEALAIVVQSPPDIVFADIMMPRLDGYQMCALLKSNADYEHIPVIMLSGKDGWFDRERALLVGSDAHVSKPFTVEALATALKLAHRNRPTRTVKD